MPCRARPNLPYRHLDLDQLRTSWLLATHREARARRWMVVLISGFVMALTGMILTIWK